MDHRPLHDARTHEVRTPLSDERLAELVRDAVDEWHLPPRRLDEVTWRERVGVSPARVRAVRPAARAGGVATPLIAAAVLTVFALVAASLGVAWLNARPAPRPGASGGAASGEPTPSGGAAPQPLPEFATSGSPLPAGSLVVQTEGVIKLVDLATGEATASLPNSWPEGTPYIFELPGGGYVHIGTSVETPWGSEEQVATVTVEMLDAEFRELGVVEAGRYVGHRDAELGDDGPFGASVVPSVDPSGRYAFIGWSRRVAGAWESGVDIVDLQRTRVIDQLVLPNAASSVDGTALEVLAPVVRAQAEGGSLLSIARASRDWTRHQGPGTGVPDKEERWWISRDGEQFSDPVDWIDPTADAAGGCERILDESFAAEVMYYVLCEARKGDDPTGGYVVRIQDLAEGGLHDVPLDGMAPDDSAVGTAVRGSTLWVWQASGAIAEVDLADWNARTVLDIGTDRSVTSASDPLRQLGRMLVPSVSAKPWHEDGSANRRLLVPSPDRSLLYALQPTIWDISSGEITVPPAVWVIDATTLQAVDRWDALASWETLQLSGDGRFAFLGAPGGVDARGEPDVSWKASLVALETSTGEARLILGRVGDGALLVGTDFLG